MDLVTLVFIALAVMVASFMLGWFIAGKVFGAGKRKREKALVGATEKTGGDCDQYDRKMVKEIIIDLLMEMTRGSVGSSIYDDVILYCNDSKYTIKSDDYRRISGIWLRQDYQNGYECLKEIAAMVHDKGTMTHILNAMKHARLAHIDINRKKLQDALDGRNEHVEIKRLNREHCDMFNDPKIIDGLPAELLEATKASKQ